MAKIQFVFTKRLQEAPPAKLLVFHPANQAIFEPLLSQLPEDSLQNYQEATLLDLSIDTLCTLAAHDLAWGYDFSETSLFRFLQALEAQSEAIVLGGGHGPASLVQLDSFAQLLERFELAIRQDELPFWGRWQQG